MRCVQKWPKQDIGNPEYKYVFTCFSAILERRYRAVIMKNLLAIMGLVGLLLVVPQVASACDIHVNVIKGEKESYQAGDQFMVLVKVVLTHRACPEAINKTKFKLKGLKVLKATAWKQVSTMEYDRKLIVKVVDDTVDSLVLNVIRTCSKDGGFGSLTLAVAPRETAR